MGIAMDQYRNDIQLQLLRQIKSTLVKAAYARCSRPGAFGEHNEGITLPDFFPQPVKVIWMIFRGGMRTDHAHGTAKERRAELPLIHHEQLLSLEQSHGRRIQDRGVVGND